MNRISSIGTLLKRIYRIYSNELLSSLQKRGFRDLRPSFLEVLFFICENEGASIKDIGTGCGLKKQTMTSHLNELAKRGYIIRKSSDSDKRAQNIFLTEFGSKFKFSLLESVADLEKTYTKTIGDVELERIEFTLQHFLEKIADS